jgi:hypothetical protein
MPALSLALALAKVAGHGDASVVPACVPTEHMRSTRKVVCPAPVAAVPDACLPAPSSPLLHMRYAYACLYPKCYSN